MAKKLTDEIGKPGFKASYAFQNGEDTSKFVRHALSVQDFPPVNRDNPDEVARNVRMYFELCEKDGVRPTTTGLANALKITRRTLIRVCNGEFPSYNSKTIEIVRGAYSILEQLAEGYMQDNKINPVSGIFLMTNSYSEWEQHATTRKEVTVKHTLELPDDKLKQRYLENAYTPEYTINDNDQD